MQKCCGTQTSVYISSFSNDYRDLVTSDPEQDAIYAATGLASSMLANRISWFFDLNGPSTQLDSACSGSLTALHIACQGLRNEEASMVGQLDPVKNQSVNQKPKTSAESCRRLQSVFPPGFNASLRQSQFPFN